MKQQKSENLELKEVEITYGIKGMNITEEVFSDITKIYFQIICEREAPDFFRIITRVCSVISGNIPTTLILNLGGVQNIAAILKLI